MAVIFPVISPFSFSETKLETTYEYTCGGRVAAEFDARVSIGLEDGVLIAGEVELYGYDDNHEGAYEICNDHALTEKIRNFVLSTGTEINRAFEVLSQAALSQKATLRSPHSSHSSLFREFLCAYEECHSHS
ncbi:MAG: hypothetical protein V7776_12240 [Halopseudomonas aestusnigri]